jgi:hypothetical protein
MTGEKVSKKAIFLLLFLALGVRIAHLALYSCQAYVRAHRGESGVPEPLFWYRFWLGTKVESFASTQEERFQDYYEARYLLGTLPGSVLPILRFRERST